MIINERSTIEYCNDYALKLFKYEEKELVQGKVSMLLPHELKTTHEFIVEDYFEHDENYTKTFNNYTYALNKFDNKEVVNISIELNRIMLENNMYRFAIAFLKPPDSEEENASWGIIDPGHPFYIFWMIIMIFTLFSVMIYLPYNLILEDDSNFFFDICTDSLFIMDIFISFNLGYYDEEYKKKVMIRSKVILNYIRTYFFIDLLASFPYVYLLNTLDTSFNVRVINFLRIVRLTRLIKIEKLLKKNYIVKYLSKSETGMVILSFYRNNIGFFELFRLIVILFLCAHYYCLIFISFEIYPEIRDDSYLRQATNVFGQTMEEVYLDNPKKLYDSIVYDLISVALGYQRFMYYNQTEFVLDLVWMVIGIAFFSYVIGNMSMYISQMNLNNLEFQNKMKIIDNLSYDSNVSQELIKLLTNSLEQNKNKFENYSVDQLKPYLTKDIWRQLNRELYTDFINLFKLFEKVDFDSLPKLKAICYFKENKNVYKLNSIVNELYLVVDGKIKIFDEKMKYIKEYVENEIIGFEDFALWFKQIKQEIDSNENKKSNRIMNEKFFSRRITLGIGSDDVRYIQISYSNLAELMLQDKSLYSKFEMYYNWQKEAIGPDDIKNTERIMYTFMNNQKPGLIVLKKGMVYMQNQKFNKKLNYKVVGNNIQKYVFNLDWTELKMNKISGQYIYFLYNNYYQKMKVENNYKMIIVRKLNDDKEIEYKKMDCHFFYIIEYVENKRWSLSDFLVSKLNDTFTDLTIESKVEYCRNKIKYIIKNNNPENNIVVEQDKDEEDDNNPDKKDKQVDNDKAKPKDNKVTDQALENKEKEKDIEKDKDINSKDAIKINNNSEQNNDNQKVNNKKTEEMNGHIELNLNDDINKKEEENSQIDKMENLNKIDSKQNDSVNVNVNGNKMYEMEDNQKSNLPNGTHNHHSVKQRVPDIDTIEHINMEITTPEDLHPEYKYIDSDPIQNDNANGNENSKSNPHLNKKQDNANANANANAIESKSNGMDYNQVNEIKDNSKVRDKDKDKKQETTDQHLKEVGMTKKESLSKIPQNKNIPSIKAPDDEEVENVSSFNKYKNKTKNQDTKNTKEDTNMQNYVSINSVDNSDEIKEYKTESLTEEIHIDDAESHHKLLNLNYDNNYTSHERKHDPTNNRHIKETSAYKDFDKSDSEEMDDWVFD